MDLLFQFFKHLNDNILINLLLLDFNSSDQSFPMLSRLISFINLQDQNRAFEFWKFHFFSKILPNSQEKFNFFSKILPFDEFFLQICNLTEDENFTIFTISLEPSKLQKIWIRQNNHWNLRNLISFMRYGDKLTGNMRKSVAKLWQIFGISL